jgi:hypothetical protein
MAVSFLFFIISFARGTQVERRTGSNRDGSSELVPHLDVVLVDPATGNDGEAVVSGDFG